MYTEISGYCLLRDLNKMKLVLSTFNDQLRYVKSCEEIYQESSYIITTFKHSRNTVKQVDHCSSSSLVGLLPCSGPNTALAVK